VLLRILLPNAKEVTRVCRKMCCEKFLIFTTFSSPNWARDPNEEDEMGGNVRVTLMGQIGKAYPYLIRKLG
jgi:hypothetical protein